MSDYKFKTTSLFSFGAMVGEPHLLRLLWLLVSICAPELTLWHSFLDPNAAQREPVSQECCTSKFRGETNTFAPITGKRGTHQETKGYRNHRATEDWTLPISICALELNFWHPTHQARLARFRNTDNEHPAPRDSYPPTKQG